MDEIILEFIDAYKKLDEICKQIFASDTGISKYIDEMEKEPRRNTMNIVGWNNDYKQLKHMRWIRNQLVHDTNSFQMNLVTLDDIEWLKSFKSRIVSCTDPFSSLNQLQKQESVKQVKYQIKQSINQGNVKQEKCPINQLESTYSNKSILSVVGILLAIILFLLIIK